MIYGLWILHHAYAVANNASVMQAKLQGWEFPGTDAIAVAFASVPEPISHSEAVLWARIEVAVARTDMTEAQLLKAWS